MSRPWREVKDLVGIGFAQEWVSVLNDLETFHEDTFDHRDTSIWKYIFKTLNALNQSIDIESLIEDYDPHPTLLHAMFCDIRLLGFDFQFAKYLESKLTHLSPVEATSIQQRFKSGDSETLQFEDWRNSYGLVSGRPAHARGGLKSSPWLRMLYQHSSFADEDYEKAFLDCGYHRARPVETLSRLQMRLCGLVGAKKSVHGDVFDLLDKRSRFLADCAAAYQWMRLAPI